MVNILIARLLFLTIPTLIQGTPVYDLDTVDEVPIGIRERVVLESVENPRSKQQWIAGSFPSEKIIVEEGRLGTRRRNDQGQWVQVFTFIAGGGRHDQLLPVEFWYIKPHFAEQYFNDPEAYAMSHGGDPNVKIVNFRMDRDRKKEKDL